MRDPETVVREFCAMWPERNVERFLGYFTDDAVYHNMPLEPVTGKNGIREVLNLFLPAQEIEAEVVYLAARGNLVFTERIDRFRFGDKRVELPCAGVFEIRDGKIAAWRDLLATAVDRHRAAPEADDRAVGEDAGVVAGHRVARAAHHGEGACGLGGILVVAERDVARAPHPADLVRAGLHESREVLLQHHRARNRERARADCLAPAARVRALRAGLGGAVAVDHGHVREALQERLLVVRREDGAARAEHEEAREVVLPAVEVVEERAREGVADDGERA